MGTWEKLVVVTKKTALEELVERFNTVEQARFYIEQMGDSFAEYQAAHDRYQCAKKYLQGALPGTLRVQWIERSFVPTFLFGEHDLVVTLGPDGLVVNVAKYLGGQPLLAFNPDASRIDGVLVPFFVESASPILGRVLRDKYECKRVVMAKAQLNDGQTMLALNDLFIGQASHVSARYHLQFGGHSETQISSGIIVSTGAGSTGWMRSVVTGASRVVTALHPQNSLCLQDDCRFSMDAERLLFSVREPFVSKTSNAQCVFGEVAGQNHLEIHSLMPRNGVIFSDGIEDDTIAFNSGSIARIGIAEKRVQLIAGV
jgi:NAD kinase